MCGSGTTALTAYALGFSVVASDLMYPAFTITSAKLHRLSQESIRSMTEVSDAIELSRRKNAYRKWLNWDLWYTPKVLGSLEQICEQIEEVRNRAFFPHLLTAFFQAAWDMSSADRNVIVPTRSQFNRSPPRLRGKQIAGIFRRRVGRMIGAQTALETLGLGRSRPKVRRANALEEGEWPANRFQIIMTSPPYGCGVDYERAFRLQMRFWNRFLPRPERVSQLIGRRGNLSENEQALPFSEHKAKWCKTVRRLDEGRLRMFLQYVADMKTFLGVCSHRLDSGGVLCLVIGNPEIARVKVPLVRIIRKLAEEKGFTSMNDPEPDMIRTRIQNFNLRSATGPINREYVLNFRLG